MTDKQAYKAREDCIADLYRQAATIDAKAVQIMVWLVNDLNGNGESFTSKTRLMALVGLGKDALANRLDALEQVGLIKDTGRRVGKTGQVTVWQVLERGGSDEATPDPSSGGSHAEASDPFDRESFGSHTGPPDPSSDEAAVEGAAKGLVRGGQGAAKVRVRGGQGAGKARVDTLATRQELMGWDETPSDQMDAPALWAATPTSALFENWDEEAYRRQLERNADSLFRRIDRLLDEHGPLALCCWELHPEDCHRIVLADFLIGHGVRVVVR